MKKLLLLVPMMCVSILPFKTWKVFIPEHQEQKKEITYIGYGSILAKKLYYEHNLTEYEVCIIMVETGGVIPKSYNIGNLRKRNLSYHKYKSFEEGLTHFLDVMSKKYKNRFTNDPEQTFKSIQVNYAPDGGKTWVQRCMFWYKLLFDEKTP